MPRTIHLVASGDLRESANRKCWPAQRDVEARFTAAAEALGASVVRAHPVDEGKGHGFIDSQRYGMDVFAGIPDGAPVAVVEAVWQYSHHVLAGLADPRRGPILTCANFDGTWPGLVGMLNLNGSLTKAGVAYSTLWSDDFTDDAFRAGLKAWLGGGVVKHDASHARPLDGLGGSDDLEAVGRDFAAAFRRQKAILGVFDEGCMGMFNAIVPDHLLHPTGAFKERLSQSALYARMRTVTDTEARAVYDWLVHRGVDFDLGPNPEANLTEAQVLEQCKMYVAALRIADEFGCAAVGIQYQQGLKDLAPASDLVEGMLNSVERPPAYHEGTGDELYPGEALPHFNEVDECAGLDGLVTYRLWRQLGYAPENTLHDLRWGRDYSGLGIDADGRPARIDGFVWVFEISGAAPPAHFVGGWAGASSERQPPMYFRLGGGTMKGVSKPGHGVWSRVWVDGSTPGGALRFDTGLFEAVGLPESETRERLDKTTPQWPVMHAVLPGVTRDQMMGRHKANHVQVAYAPDRASAVRALYAKAHAMQALGLGVTVCGTVD